MKGSPARTHKSNSMGKHWWKIAAVLILLYSLVAGLLVPLRPGIVKVSPSRAEVGQAVQLNVEGYNTLFSRADGHVRAWLKLDEAHALAATSVDVQSDQRLVVSFQLPPQLPGTAKVKDASLILDDPANGASVMPSALFISQPQARPNAPADLWNAGIENLHQLEGINFPFRNILSETIRNTYYHVPLWFGMIIIFLVSMIYSWRYLQHGRRSDDRYAVALTQVGILFGLLGLVTGALWARWTWGQFWSWDVKQNMAAIAMLIYMAYFVLRHSFDDFEKQARLGAVYNIFAFAALIPLLFVIPRMTDSLHPGNGGNPGLGGEDLDNTMRMVFYPAIIGWTLLGFWMAQLAWRLEELKDRLYSR